MEAFPATDAPAALILEDDAELHSGLPKVISCLDWWPDGHGVVSLQCHVERPWPSRPVGFTGFGHELRPIPERNTGAAGCLIDRRTAAELVAMVPDIRMPVDILLFRVNWSGFARRIRPLLLTPTLIHQRPIEVVGTDTGEWKVDGVTRFRPSPIFRCPHKLRLRCWLAPTGQAKRMQVPVGSSR